MRLSAPITPQILLVDDSRDGLLVRRALLEEFGYRVQVASSCEEGLKVYKSSNFDVVVTNHRVPGLNGLDLIARIRVENPNARVILVCGLTEPLGLTEENTGADVVIAKNSKEAAQLSRWVKRLSSRAPSRKPPAKQERVSFRARSLAR